MSGPIILRGTARQRRRARRWFNRILRPAIDAAPMFVWGEAIEVRLLCAEGGGR